nr:probable UDP-N-acetylglucosamine--peptide N-acetylglucosaminyltransferase SPINDLY [Tanacetum cinerariifolium]
NRLLAMNYINAGTDDKLFEAHSSGEPERPLVIGYVSPDYFTHYADTKTMKFRDSVLKRDGMWRDIYGLEEKKVASIVRDDKVDILVELTSHTANNKLGWLAILHLFRFLSTLEQLGLESLRVNLLPSILLNHDHMQAYSLMDISLDTFPYAGTTTTCESLYMGVPCVTMGDSVHAHNVGVSLLNAVGLEHLVAKTEDEYIRLAIHLASDVTSPSNLRMVLRNLMSKSPLCNGSKFINGLEFAYRDMWRGYCKEQVKQHNKKREAAASEGKGPKDDDDESYEVNLDENFLMALGYRMPPALGMTLRSELSNEVGFLVINTSFDALLESLL